MASQESRAGAAFSTVGGETPQLAPTNWFPLSKQKPCAGCAQGSAPRREDDFIWSRFSTS